MSGRPEEVDLNFFAGIGMDDPHDANGTRELPDVALDGLVAVSVAEILDEVLPVLWMLSPAPRFSMIASRYAAAGDRAGSAEPGNVLAAFEPEPGNTLAGFECPSPALRRFLGRQQAPSRGMLWPHLSGAADRTGRPFPVAHRSRPRSGDTSSQAREAR